jgi:tetratricopeptide (TPR) repeat protein
MLAGILLSLLFVISMDAGSNEPSYAGVEQQIQRGELTAAQQTLDRALATDERDFAAHLLLGIVLQEEGHPEDALKHFNRARALHSNDAAPYVNIGRVLASQGDLDSAAHEFATAARLDPGNATAHSNWGIILFRQQRWHEAIAQLRTAITLKPDDVASLGILFQAYLQAADFASARGVAARIEHSSPPTAESLATMGALEGKAGDYPDAVVNLRKALAMEPDSSEAAYNLALALLRDRKADEARIELEKLRDRQESAEVEDLLGEVYETEKRPVDAVRSFERAAKLEPQNEDYSFSYLSELLSHKSYDAAILVGNAAVHNLPNSVRLRLALAAALDGAGKAQEADSVVLQASQDFPDSNLPLYLRSVLAEGGHQSDAGLAADAQRYVARHPQDPVALLVVGREEDRQGNPKAAILALNQSLAFGKNSAEAELTTAKVYGELQDWEQVIAHARRAVSLDPDLQLAWYRLAVALDRVGRKNEGNAAMKRFLSLKTSQAQSPVNTFIYKLH